ncbi:MAG: PIG-L family deacetylase [Chloroflexota bacterium]
MKYTLLAVLAHPDDESFGLGGTLARYAREGVDVHIAIATDGVAGSVAEGYEDTLATLVEVRKRELAEAVDVLGGTLHMLGFRDSGYIGDPANEHPQAFINIDPRISTERVTFTAAKLQQTPFLLLQIPTSIPKQVRNHFSRSGSTTLHFPIAWSNCLQP